MSLHIERNASQIEIVVSARGGHAALLATLAAHLPGDRPGVRLRARGEVLRVSLPARSEAEDAALLRALRRARHGAAAGV